MPKYNLCALWHAGEGQRCKLYEHVHVLRCDFPHDTRQKPTKQFLIVKPKPIEGLHGAPEFEWLPSLPISFAFSAIFMSKEIFARP